MSWWCKQLWLLGNSTSRCKKNITFQRHLLGFQAYLIINYLRCQFVAIVTELAFSVTSIVTELGPNSDRSWFWFKPPPKPTKLERNTACSFNAYVSRIIRTFVSINRNWSGHGNGDFCARVTEIQGSGHEMRAKCARTNSLFIEQNRPDSPGGLPGPYCKIAWKKSYLPPGLPPPPGPPLPPV